MNELFWKTSAHVCGLAEIERLCIVSVKGGFVVVPLRLFFGAPLLLLLMCGCSSGPRLVKANGQLLFKDAPLVVDEKAGINIWFIRLDPDDAPATYPASPLNREDATFSIPGAKGNGIPVGKYRIAIRQRMADDLPANIEKMNEMFSRESSQIVREVTNAEPIVLDLSKPEG